MKRMKKKLVTLLVPVMLTSFISFKTEAQTVSAVNTSTSSSVLYSVTATQNGWKTISGKKYYYVNGKKTTGWKKISGYWYYFNKDGSMKKGWLKWSGNWYFLSGIDGKMKTGKVKIGGIMCNFKSSGELIQKLNKELSIYCNTDLGIFVRHTTNLKDEHATSAKGYCNANMVVEDGWFNNKICYISICNNSKHAIAGTSLGMTPAQVKSALGSKLSYISYNKPFRKDYKLKNGTELWIYYDNNRATDIAIVSGIYANN